MSDMADSPDSQLQRWLHEPDPSAVRRGIGIGITWAYVAGLAAVVMVALATLVALAVAATVYLVDFANRAFDLEVVRGPTSFMAWVALVGAAAASVWAVAFASTRSQSVLTASAGATGLVLGALLMWRVQSTAIAMLPLAVGWSVAIPVEHPGRLLARILPPLVAVLFFPSWPSMSVVSIVAWMAAGPLVGGGLALLGDLGWSGVARIRGTDDMDDAGLARSSGGA